MQSKAKCHGLLQLRDKVQDKKPTTPTHPVANAAQKVFSLGCLKHPRGGSNKPGARAPQLFFPAKTHPQTLLKPPAMRRGHLRFPFFQGPPRPTQTEKHMEQDARLPQSPHPSGKPSQKDMPSTPGEKKKERKGRTPLQAPATGSRPVNLYGGVSARGPCVSLVGKGLKGGGKTCRMPHFAP